MSTPRTLSRARLRRAGPPGADALDWASRAALGALALAGVWTLWTVVRSLPAPVAVGAAPPSVDAPAIELNAESADARLARLNELARLNRFAPGGLPWKPKLEPLAEAPANPDDPANGGAPVVTVAPTVRSDPALTPLDRVPDDVKKALSAIELRGLRTDEEGTSLAMISRVHGTNRSASTPYRTGEEFLEESNNQAKWRVVAIDWLQRRVLLSRSGVTVELPLYKGAATIAAAKANAVAAEAAAAPGARQKPDPQRTGMPGAPAVVIIERAEAIAQLRQAGVSEEDIAEIIAALDTPLPKPAPPTEVAQEGEGKDAPARSGPPAGMEAIIKMMQEQAKQTAPQEGEEQQRPKRRPRAPK